MSKNYVDRKGFPASKEMFAVARYINMSDKEKEELLHNVMGEKDPENYYDACIEYILNNMISFTVVATTLYPNNKEDVIPYQKVFDKYGKGRCAKIYECVLKNSEYTDTQNVTIYVNKRIISEAKKIFSDREIENFLNVIEEIVNAWTAFLNADINPRKERLTASQESVLETIREFEETGKFAYIEAGRYRQCSVKTMKALKTKGLIDYDNPIDNMFVNVTTTRI